MKLLFPLSFLVSVFAVASAFAMISTRPMTTDLRTTSPRTAIATRPSMMDATRPSMMDDRSTDTRSRMDARRHGQAEIRRCLQELPQGIRKQFEGRPLSPQEIKEELPAGHREDFKACLKGGAAHEGHEVRSLGLGQDE